MSLAVLDAPPRWRRSQLAAAFSVADKVKRADGTSASAKATKKNAP